MTDFIIARAVHIFSVVIWIGGVAFVTLVVMPSIRTAYPPSERLLAFQQIEGRFAPQARIWVLLAGASGFWMVYRGQMWDRFTDPRFWWMDAMLGLWALFMVMLFVVEPFILHRLMRDSANPRIFRRMEIMHWILFTLAAITVLGAVAGSHGLV